MTSIRRDDLQITTLPTPTARLGESPVWLPETQEVLWVDMPNGRIHFTGLLTGASRTVATPTYLGAVAPAASGGYLVACREGFATISPDGGYEPLPPVLRDGHRMNDAQCDPVGRFWAGSLDVDFQPGEGMLWCLDATGSPRVVLEGLTQPNGLAWSPDAGTFYLIDTAERELTAFEYNPATGGIAGRRLVRSFPELEGYADGMTVDADGCLLIAMWGAGAIIRIAPDGDFLDWIPVPVTHPTSCAFVGDELDQLVVTSADESVGGQSVGGQSDGVVEGVPGGSLLLVSGLPGRGLRPRTARVSSAN